MRGVMAIVACIGLALSAAGHATDRAPQTALLNEYVNSVCAQASPKAACDGNWSTLVQAGMNDIDGRCDAFLAWLTARSRSEKAINEETVLGKIMTLSGPSPEPLDIVAAAFGFPNPSHAAQSAQRLTSIDRLTVLQIVFTARMQFRSKFTNGAVPDRPAAIGLLRDHLQFCIPATIEASISAGAAK
jgi:hypothetical protein